MKKILSFVLMMCVLMTIPMFAFAAVSGDEPLTIGTPFMITNAGQDLGGKMGRLLVSRAGTLTEDEDFYYVDVPYAADVDARDYSAIVIGSTDKGLGATGITIDQEIARVDEVVARANEKGVPVIAVMLEKDKRSDVKTNANERCIDAVCPYASWMIVKPVCIGVIGEHKKACARYMRRTTGIRAQAVERPKEWIQAQNVRHVLCAGNIKGEGRQFLEEMIEEARQNV